MNIYDMFRAIIRGCSMPFDQEADCLKLLDNLERQNAFGTIVRITSGHHAYVNGSPQQQYRQECGYCGKPRSEHDQ